MSANFDLICEVNGFLREKILQCIKNVISRIEQTKPDIISKKLIFKIKREPCVRKVNIKKFEIALDENLTRSVSEGFIRWLIAHEIAHIDCRVQRMTSLAPSFWGTFSFLLKHPRYLVRPWFFAFTAKIQEDIYVNRKVVEWGFIDEFVEFAEKYYVRNLSRRVTFAEGITGFKDKLIYFLGEDYLTDILHFLDKDQFESFYESLRNISLIFHSLYPKEILRAAKKIYEEIWKHEFPIDSKGFRKIFDAVYERNFKFEELYV